MSESISLFINHIPVVVDAGTTVAAALAMAGADITRISVGGMPRAPVCGMGICQECRVTINGRAHQLACQTLCLPAMQVRAGWSGDQV